MAAVKQGLLKLPAFEFVGQLTVVDIGLPDDLASFHELKTEVADYDLVAGLLPERGLDSHKGTFGTALIAAGSLNYTGAALLAGRQPHTASGQAWSPWQCLNLCTPRSLVNSPKQPGFCFRMKQASSQKKHPKYC